MIRRSSGLLLHVTSLPGGRLGREAFRFVDFCAAAGQRWWQVLPVTPPGKGDSPYDSPSAFAGSESLLDDAADGPAGGLAAFRERQGHWLADYALFMALRDRHGAPWTRWPRTLRDRRPAALVAARYELGSTIERHELAQLRFHRQWRELRRHARTRGVRLIGDLPFFVAHDSADVWAHRELFKLDRSGSPRVVAGVPPDYFSRTGQHWGNPHYDWSVHGRRRFRWWRQRIRRMFEFFDAVRLDHFLGILRAWEIPARARTARRGRWAAGPGAALMRALRGEIGRRLVIAEDLGLVTPEATALREQFGWPGMRVLHFSFGADPAGRPDRFPRRCVAYTGTHDNNTTVGWFREGGADRKRAREYAKCRRDRIHWGLIRVAQTCPAHLAIVPVQDLLGLGARARMNRPGRQTGNWRWQLQRGQLKPIHAHRLRVLTEGAGR